jgi:hypothetical protein
MEIIPTPQATVVPPLVDFVHQSAHNRVKEREFQK